MACEPWPIRWACDVCDADTALLEAAQSSAQQILWGLTGRRFGICTVTEEFSFSYGAPCGLPYDVPSGVEYAVYGNILYWPDGRCKIKLSQPARAIIEVRVNGVVLDPSDYELQRDGLTRLNTDWPSDSECATGAVSIDYSYGVDVPPLGEIAMGELACEILRALEGKDCQLPSNVTSVARQGVTVNMGDSAALFEQGRVGLAVCDAFIRAVNPNQLHRAPSVRSPDLARRTK